MHFLVGTYMYTRKIKENDEYTSKTVTYKPPLTSPLVHIALIDRVVMTHTIADIAMMTRVSPIPA